MTDSNYVFEAGEPIDVGSHGQHDYVFHSGDPVLDRGQSPFVFESGTGLRGGIELVYDNTAIQNEDVKFFDNGATFEAGTYSLTVEGEGYAHNDTDPNNAYFCDEFISDGQVPDNTDIWFKAPCQRLEDDTGQFDTTYAVIEDFDNDGDNDIVFGMFIIYPGGPYTIQTPEGTFDGSPQTYIFDEKDLSGPPFSGNGEFTTTSSGPIGVFNMDEQGSGGDNAADLTYSLA